MVVALRQNRNGLLCIKIHHFEGITLANVGQFLAVWRNIRLVVVFAVCYNLLIIKECGGIEVLLCSIFQSSLKNVPVTVNLCSIVESLAVRCPGNHSLLVRSVGDSLGACIVNAHNKDFSAVNQRNLLTVRAYRHLRGVVYVEALNLLVACVGCY